MNKVVMYCINTCQYCDKAEKLLKKKGVEVNKINIEGNKPKIKEMLKRTRRNTVPQIFIDGEHIGGFDELAKLDKKGKLNALLND